MKAMKTELSKSNFTDDEILSRTRKVMKAFGKEDEKGSLLDLSLASKQNNSALKRAQISPRDFAKVGIVGDERFFTHRVHIESRGHRSRLAVSAPSHSRRRTPLSFVMRSLRRPPRSVLCLNRRRKAC